MSAPPLPASLIAPRTKTPRSRCGLRPGSGAYPGIRFRRARGMCGSAGEASWCEGGDHRRGTNHRFVGSSPSTTPANLDQLVVAPDHWGSPLATALVDEAKRLSPDLITLLVNTDNARAIRFYERNGLWRMQAKTSILPRAARCCVWRGRIKAFQARQAST